jgi:hypothetical protein
MRRIVKCIGFCLSLCPGNGNEIFGISDTIDTSVRDDCPMPRPKFRSVPATQRLQVPSKPDTPEAHSRPLLSRGKWHQVRVYSSVGMRRL